MRKFMISWFLYGRLVFEYFDRGMSIMSELLRGNIVIHHFRSVDWQYIIKYSFNIEVIYLLLSSKLGIEKSFESFLFLCES